MLVAGEIRDYSSKDMCVKMTMQEPIFNESSARAILYEWVESESLRKHCEAVAASMRHFARKHDADEELWAATGLLHDADYEKFPNLELSETGHPFVTVHTGEGRFVALRASQRV